MSTPRCPPFVTHILVPSRTKSSPSRVQSRAARPRPSPRSASVSAVGAEHLARGEARQPALLLLRAAAFQDRRADEAVVHRERHAGRSAGAVQFLEHERERQVAQPRAAVALRDRQTPQAELGDLREDLGVDALLGGRAPSARGCSSFLGEVARHVPHQGQLFGEFEIHGCRRGDWPSSAGSIQLAGGS